LIEFTAAIARLRREHPTFRRSRFFDGRPVRRGQGEPLPDVEWVKPDSTPMEPEDWESGFGRTIGMWLNGQGIHGVDARGEHVTDVCFLVYYSAHDEPVALTLPDADHGAAWDVIVDTAGDRVDGASLAAGAECSVNAHSFLVLREHTEAAAGDSAVSATLAPPSTAAAIPSEPPGAE
jgi:glycogen operon protein